MTNCSTQDCANLATVVPVLALFHRGSFDPVQAELNMPLCDDCAIKSTAATFLTDETFENLVNNFKVRGRPIPIRELTKVNFELIKE